MSVTRDGASCATILPLAADYQKALQNGKRDHPVLAAQSKHAFERALRLDAHLVAATAGDGS